MVLLGRGQAVCLIRVFDDRAIVDDFKEDQCSADGDWRWLAGTNILLSLTSILSMGEIAAASWIWWLSKERDWRKYLALTALPVLIILFYYCHAPHYQFYFELSPEQLIRDNFSRERVDFLFIFLILLSIFSASQRGKIKLRVTDAILKPCRYIIFLGVVLAFSAGVLWLFAFQVKSGPVRFPITSRYFIYLTPIGVIAATLLTVAIV